MNKEIKNFADHLVYHYSQYDKLCKRHIIDINFIPDFELDEFASILMKYDEDVATEATSPDNPEYFKSMLPALTKFMSDSTNKDERIEFVNVWQKGVTSYFYNRMDEILNDRMDEFNYDRTYRADNNTHAYM